VEGKEERARERQRWKRKWSGGNGRRRDQMDLDPLPKLLPDPVSSWVQG